MMIPNPKLRLVVGVLLSIFFIFDDGRSYDGRDGRWEIGGMGDGMERDGTTNRQQSTTGHQQKSLGVLYVARGSTEVGTYCTYLPIATYVEVPTCTYLPT